MDLLGSWTFFFPLPFVHSNGLFACPLSTCFMLLFSLKQGFLISISIVILLSRDMMHAKGIIIQLLLLLPWHHVFQLEGGKHASSSSPFTFNIFMPSTSCPFTSKWCMGFFFHLWIHPYKGNHFLQCKYVTLVTFFPLVYSNQNSFHKVFIYFVFLI